MACPPSTDADHVRLARQRDLLLRELVNVWQETERQHRPMSDALDDVIASLRPHGIHILSKPALERLYWQLEEKLNITFAKTINYARLQVEAAPLLQCFLRDGSKVRLLERANLTTEDGMQEGLAETSQRGGAGYWRVVPDGRMAGSLEDDIAAAWERLRRRGRREDAVDYLEKMMG